MATEQQTVIAPPPRPAPSRTGAWPEIPFQPWASTCATLHRWAQMVGKVRLALEPHRNHWWHVPLYVSARGLTTSMMPLPGGRALELELDFLSDHLRAFTSDGAERMIPLRPQAVADFYAALMEALRELGAEVAIWTTPVEIDDRVPFEHDRVHSDYDADAARRFWHALVCVEPVIDRFQSRFLGKVSPTHFFWGSLDLASTRFSGRAAPPHPGGPNVARFVMREAYSRELSSCGFWPGGSGYEAPAFYSYAYPEPEGFRSARIEPTGVVYHDVLREFILPYDVVRASSDPVETLLTFFQSTYDAAADLGRWDRAILERPECVPSPVR